MPTSPPGSGFDVRLQDRLDCPPIDQYRSASVVPSSHPIDIRQSARELGFLNKVLYPTTVQVSPQNIRTLNRTTHQFMTGLS